MKFLFLYNFIFNKSTGFYTACQIDFKKKEEKYPMSLFNEAFLNPENNFDLRLALYVAKELNTFEVNSEKNIFRIWLDVKFMNFFILTSCNDQDEMIKLNDIGLSLLKKYSSLSPNINLKNLSGKIQTIGRTHNLNIDDDYLGFFSGEEKHGYFFNFVN